MCGAIHVKEDADGPGIHQTSLVIVHCPFHASHCTPHTAPTLAHAPASEPTPVPTPTPAL